MFSRLKSWADSSFTWVRVAEIFVGLFFIAAAMYKAESYLIHGDQSLRGHFEYWISMDLPPMWYRAFIHFLFDLPYGEHVLEIVTLGLQATAGFLILVHYRTRIAGCLLLFVQANIFLGTFNHLGFNQFVGISLWLGFFFAVRVQDEHFGRRRWQMVTLVFFLLQLLYLWNRFAAGDAAPASMGWQREHFMQEILPSAFWWKQFVLWITSFGVGPYLWASVWWLELVGTLLLLTPKKLWGGALLLIMVMIQTFTWANSITSHGVISVLALFLWVTQEEFFVRKGVLPKNKHARIPPSIRLRHPKKKPRRKGRGS